MGAERPGSFLATSGQPECCDPAPNTPIQTSSQGQMIRQLQRRPAEDLDAGIHQLLL